MKRLAVLATLAAACAFGANAWASSDDTSTPPPQLTVHMKDFAFKPDAATIAPGTVVTFVNEDPATHTVTASDHSFDSKDIAPGKTWKMTFSNPGTYAYTCVYHPSMTAKITVSAGT